MASSRWLLVACLLPLAAPAAAKPAYGTSVDQKCTANGWVPARPYNPNNLLTTDPKKVNCGLCHTNALNPSKALNAAGQIYKTSGRTDVSPFCRPPAPMNHAPAFAAVAAQQATVGQFFQLAVSATDADGDAIALSVSNSPTGATFTDNGNGSGSFAWTPGAVQTGNRMLTFHADDAGSPMASATLDVTISVGAVTNRPPVLAAIGDQQVDPGAMLSLTLSATDPENDALSFDLLPLPSGASLLGGQLSWTPTAGQVGSYPVTVSVADDGSPSASDSEAIIITVGRVNHLPRLSPIGNRTVDLGTSGRIALVATDADQDVIALTCSGLPSDATLTDVGDGTGEIVWSPGATGTYTVTCRATDNALSQGVAQETFMLSARDPAPPAGAPLLSEATWYPDRHHGVLRVVGALDVSSARDPAMRLEIFALLADGSLVKLSRQASKRDSFSATLQPFIPPCRVAAAWNGVLGAPMPVAGAPPECDARVLMQVRAKSSCDGFRLRVAGRRAPPEAVITGSDIATGDVVFTVATNRGGSFQKRIATTSFVQALEVRVESGGAAWTLAGAVPVANACR
jgi:Putative Ig domain/Bacterial Ig domain